METKSLPEEIFHYATKGSAENMEYYHFHLKLSQNPSHKHHLKLLENFLFATMDEVRLRNANEYANLVLFVTDIDDAKHFREGVLRRELTADIEYHKQRDHAAHTLHNYLLGWYIFSNCPKFRETFKKQIERRTPWEFNGNNEIIHYPFGEIWPFVSLVHDIGYLFEGGLNPLSTEVGNERVKRGASVAQDYFHHRFWYENAADSVDKRERLLRLAGMESDAQKPDFSGDSIASVADALRYLGNLELLRKNVQKELKEIQEKLKKEEVTVPDVPDVPDVLHNGKVLPEDPFDLWYENYNAYGQKDMAERILNVKKVYQKLVWEGLPGLGVRLLDHGVCSGLLMLQYSTFFFRLYYGLLPKYNSLESISDIKDAETVKAFIENDTERLTKEGIKTSAAWWWAGVVWGTAACAVHNVLQLDLKDFSIESKPLKLEEDSLAYLGILVDILEEWDRYTVSGNSAVVGSLPLQGRDVKLGTENGRITIDYGHKERADKVRRELNKYLDAWNDLVEVLPAQDT